MGIHKTCVISAKVTDTVWLFLMPFVGLLREQGYMVKVIAGEGKYAYTLQSNDLILEKVDYQFTLNPIKFLNLFTKTRNFLLDENPFILICNDPSASFITRLAAKSAGIKNIIYFCHGLPFAPHSNLLEKIFFYTLEKLASYFTDAVITMNSYDYTIGKKFYKKVYRINGVGVNLSQYNSAYKEARLDIQKKLGISENSTVIAFIGRLISQKGIWFLLNASKELIHKRGKEIIFLIIGEGPLKEDISKFIKINDLADSVKFLGYSENVQDLLGAIDILVLPTYYTEGLPRIILEAMASGVPIIATNVRGCQDIIDNGVDGILIPFKNSKSIINAIEKLIDDKEFYERLKHNAYQKIIKSYATPVVLDQFDNIIKDFLLHKN